MARLRGMRVVPHTENGVLALARALAQEGDSREKALARGLWRIIRDAEGVTFEFRTLGFNALALSMLKAPRQLRRFYEQNIEQLEAQFHRMMRECGAFPDDYDVVAVWR